MLFKLCSLLLQEAMAVLEDLNLRRHAVQYRLCATDLLKPQIYLSHIQSVEQRQAKVGLAHNACQSHLLLEYTRGSQLTPVTIM